MYSDSTAMVRPLPVEVWSPYPQVMEYSWEQHNPWIWAPNSNGKWSNYHTPTVFWEERGARMNVTCCLVVTPVHLPCRHTLFRNWKYILFVIFHHFIGSVPVVLLSIEVDPVVLKDQNLRNQNIDPVFDAGGIWAPNSIWARRYSLLKKFVG